MFSGVGVLIITGMFWIFRHFISSNFICSNTKSVNKSRLQFKINDESNNENIRKRIPDAWQGILPAQSKYKIVDEISYSMPGGLQTFSFEYGPHGHSQALVLNKILVRAEIQFTCQVLNPVKAMFGANEYALNVLQPRFLVQSRNILEKFSLKQLREKRQEVAQNILDFISPQFEELGFHLESVTIGALEQINS